MATWVRTTRIGEDEMRLDIRLGRVYKAKFQVEFTAAQPYPEPLEALYSPGVPRIQSSYLNATTFDLGALCQLVTPTRDVKVPWRFWVTCEYASRTLDPQQQSIGGGGGESGSPNNDNPLLEPPKISWSPIHDVKVLDREVDPDIIPGGYTPRAIRNSSGQPLAPRPTVDRSRPSMTYVRNEPSENMLYYTDYWDTTNAYPFRGYDPGLVKCSYIIQNLEFRNNLAYWVTTYHFEFRQRQCPTESIINTVGGTMLGLGWDIYPVDAGTRILDANGKLIPIVNGLPAGDNLLDGFGHLLNPDQTAPILQPPVHHAYFGYARKDFEALGLVFP